MPQTVIRGYVPTDTKEFSEQSILVLKEVQTDLFYLINRGYEITRSVTFLANKYKLSTRQRMALTRATSTVEDINLRLGKEIINDFSRKSISIDGFNIIISLEIALSNSTLLKCMDGTIRDLAGLHGTYRIIDKTSLALDLIKKELEKMKISNVEIFLDAPVSNSGNLKKLIYDNFNESYFKTEVHLENNVDEILCEKEFVVSGDAIILNKCNSWINLASIIIENNLKSCKIIDLS